MLANQTWLYAIVWEFRARPGCEWQFEQVYGPNGDWAKLFSVAEGYLRTELMRDEDNPGRYLSIDLWRSRQDYDSFRQRHAEEYRRLDEKCEEMTENEFAVGVFERIQSSG